MHLTSPSLASVGGDHDAEPLPGWAEQLVTEAAVAGDDVAVGLRLAAHYGRLLPNPGGGATCLRWRVLAAVGEVDLTLARILESHADALAILDEAGCRPPEGTWGVFAAETPQALLSACRTGGKWRLTGSKSWCSLGDRVDKALVTAHVPGGRQLFAVDLSQAGVTSDPPERWVARGLRAVTSCGLRFDKVDAEPVGDVGWYFERAGFAWGGMGVAACWSGGADGLVAELRRRRSGTADPLVLMQIGQADCAQYAARSVLADAARRIDSAAATGSEGSVLALRVRSVVAEAAEQILRVVGHALGPAPLAFDERFARRTADLQLYIRQHHGERDLAALGAAVLT